jgi:hypothetical protein
MSERTPPMCYSCGNSCEDDMETTHYCICDIAVCHNCINSVKKNESTWICPHCKEENDVEKSLLFRSS